jgi:hypothetical protein
VSTAARAAAPSVTSGATVAVLGPQGQACPAYVATGNRAAAAVNASSSA